jgi:CRISPR-associated protein Csb1
MTPNQNTMSNTNTPPASALPMTFGGFTIPAGCRRIFITAELEPSNGDPRIQPTGFPDIGPVLYPDPAGTHGLICLIESEASMANRLEEVCFEPLSKHEGKLRDAFKGLPYLRAEKGGDLKTASTLDGHRFASDFLAKGTADFGSGNKSLAAHIKESLGMAADGKTMPIANVPNVFPLVLGLDTMSLIHGFQVSNEQISFVGLRLPRALSASIAGFGCERISVPGIKFNVGQVESESGQAIFQKPRITAKKIEARFSIDVGLLTSLRLDTPDANGAPGHLQAARVELLLAIALWKVAAFLDLLSIELSLRTECKLRLKRGENGSAIPPKAVCEGGSTPSSDSFPFAKIAQEVLVTYVTTALPGTDEAREARSPLKLQFA